MKRWVGRQGRLILGACAALSAVNVVAPGSLGSRVSYEAAAILATAATWIGASKRDGAARRAWSFLASGLTLWVAGDIASDAYAIAHLDSPVFSLADALDLAAYPMFAVGVARMIRMRYVAGLRNGFLDGLALAVCAALASWEFLVAPNVQGLRSLPELLVGAAYPLGDVCLLAAAAWLLLTVGRRGAPTYLIFAFLAATLVVDTAYELAPYFAPRFDTNYLDTMHPIAYALLAAAALHPDADELTQEARVGVGRLHAARIWCLGIALLVGPAVAVGRASGLSLGARVFLLTASGAIGAIVLARFTSAVREREAAQDQLAHRAAHDELTGLVNRPLLVDRIEHALARAVRAETTLAVLYVDLDRFKPVNDTWGHVAGDEVLVEVAARLRATVRPGDTVARVGGDEFVILCEDLDGVREATTIADRIVATIAEPIHVHGAFVSIAASVGIALDSSRAETAESLLSDADAAMYRAKESGRDRWELYDEQMRIWVQRRRETETALQTAVERGELRLMYQPVVRLTNNEVAGFEALVRWARPGQGIIPPDEFIGVAEESGLIVQIGAWVLEQACLQIARWNEANPDRAPLGISVNVSGRQFNQQDFVSTVERALSKTGIDPQWLTLEITESVLVHGADKAIAHLESVKRLGVRLAVDDFGTGYSALAYLRQFPLDVVKIDRSFIEDLGTLAPDTTLVAAIIRLAQALGHEVVAEGAETAEHMAALFALGCNYVQGFYFAPPLAAVQAAQLVGSRRDLASVRDALLHA